VFGAASSARKQLRALIPDADPADLDHTVVGVAAANVATLLVTQVMRAWP
jgi:hypothetical protein